MEIDWVKMPNCLVLMFLGRFFAGSPVSNGRHPTARNPELETGKHHRSFCVPGKIPQLVVGQYSKNQIVYMKPWNYRACVLLGINIYGFLFLTKWCLLSVSCVEIFIHNNNGQHRLYRRSLNGYRSILQFGSS